MVKTKIRHDFPAFIDRLKKRNASVAESVSLALNESGKFMVDSIRASFDKGKDPEGKEWQRLNPSVYPFRPERDGIIRWGKRPVTSTSKPLINYGTMRAGVSYVRYDKNIVLIGFGNQKEADKGIIHHYGLTNPVKFEQFGGGIRTKDITPAVRKAVGFAKWARASQVNDNAHIISIFVLAISKAVRL